jgi:predicted Zn-dependent peptidase
MRIRDLSTSRRRIIGIGFAALSCALAAGTVRADTPPLLRFETVKTPKGLLFHYREAPSTPFAAISFGMRDIWGVTTPGKEGFSSLGASLVMQGADGAGQTEFVERLKDLTATASISFAPYSTQGNVRAPTATLAASMAILASALKSARPSERLLERLKQRASGGDAQAALRAETIAERAAMWFTLGDHSITRGFDPKRFERIDRDDLAAWRQASLDRSRLRLAASGRISRHEAAGIIDNAFGDVPVLAPLKPRDWPEVAIDGGTIVVEHDTPQSTVLLVGVTGIRVGRDVETAQIATAVLSGSNGRLWQGVRAGLGSTYGASAGLMLVGPGKRLVSLRSAVDNGQVKASVEALKAVYTMWRSEGVTQAELSATTSRMVTGFRDALDDPARANGIVIGMQLASRDISEIYTYEARVGGTDRAALNRFIAEKFPAPETFLTVIVTPRAEGLGATCVVRTAEEAKGCRTPRK